MTSKGFVMFAHNNEEIDYGKIALCASLMIKANLKENKVCLVTDEGTYKWLLESVGKKLTKYAFDHVKIIGWENTKDSQKRMFRDTGSTSRNLTWHNGSRHTVYELTPFDETIVLDCDVLVQDNSFDLVWENAEDIMINRKAITLNHELPDSAERMLNTSTIPMYWATMVYFKKSEKAEMFFNLIEHIREKYDYYRFVYDFPGKLYRNDYVFSIAVHMLNGFTENNEVKSFPVDYILSSFDTDELIKVEKDTLAFLVQDKEEHWKFRVNKVKGISVHCMNKYSILRQSDKLIEIYGSDK